MKQRDYKIDHSKRFAAVSAERSTAGTAAKPTAAAGLSKLHNRTLAVDTPQPLASRITWYPGASLVEIEVPLPRQPPKQGPDMKRQKVTDWSLSSRARLKRNLGMLDREELGKALVVTLTYPAEFPAPDDHAVYKYHLKLIATYMRRRWPHCSGIWKLEFQKRGAAHYHLMIFGLWSLPIEEVRDWFRVTWYEIAHNGDENQGNAGTQVDRIKSALGAMSYFAKYMSKGDQTRPGNFTGRYWGKINAKKLPLVEPQSIDLATEQSAQYARWARKKIEKDVNGSNWRRWLEEMRERSWQGVTRLGWQVAKSAYQGGAERVPMWQRIEKEMVEIEGESFVSPGWHLRMKYEREHFRRMLSDYRPPRRWKAPKNNSRVRLLCDASRFVEAIARLDAPASSFLLWSRKKDA